MNVLIYGYGLNEGGFASAMYFCKRGHNVRITDLRDEESLGEGIKTLKKLGIEVIAGAHRVEDFKWADLVIKTPAISPDNPFLEFAKVVQNDFTYLFENENVAKTKLICISGVKDKTVTTEAVCHALNVMGKKARTCGSIDTPVFAELERWENGDNPEYLVCKMSSWQIRDTFLYSDGVIPAVELAVITSLNINAKYDIFKSQTNYLLCSQENKQQIKDILNVSLRKLSIIENNVKEFAIGLPQNLRTSFAVLKRLGFKPKEINSALQSFKGIPHRVEIVSSDNNLLVIDDSSTTIPLAVNFTLQNLANHPVHLICGGSSIQLDAKPMLEACQKVASVTLLDGSFTKKKLIPLLKKNNIEYKGPYEHMKDAVESAMKQADANKKMLQIILLCPGAPANEFFENEFDRGNQFKACFEKSTNRSV